MGRSREIVFHGPGEMAHLCRMFDWSKTLLGPVDTWSHSLRSTVSIILASRHPMFLWWGPNLVQIYNDAYRPSLSDRHPAALGANGREFWTDIWDAIGPQIEQVMSGGESTWHEDQYLPILRNGKFEDVYWTYSYSAVRDDDGSIGGTLVVCQETTARVLTEQRVRRAEALLAQQRENLLKAVFHRAPAFMAIVRGPDYVFDVVNEAYEKLVGGRAVVGLPVREALPELEAQGFVATLDRVMETGEPFIGRAVPLTLNRAPDGEPEQLYVDFIYLPILGENGEREGIIAHGTDVTDHVLSRREADRLLAESEHARADAEVARAEAQVANRAKVDFLRNMSHELRTPLNAIAGYAALMEMGIHGPVTPAQQDDLERIQISQRHLLGLINGVLSFAKLETGSLEYRIEHVNVASEVNAAIQLIEPQARVKGLQISIAQADPVLTVVADAERFRQVLVNILSNAVKFTAAGGTISVECEWSAGGEGEDDRTHDWVDDMVRIRVSDTGIGIPADKLQQIFEPFYQVNSQLSRAREGTGLGLAISRELARGMGGDLTVQSREGEGSTFEVRLPAVEP